MAGAVLAVEARLWQRDVGAAGFEDLLRLTEDGFRVLTEFPCETRLA